MTNRPVRYVVQHGTHVDGFRITDLRGDNRIATCYDRDNAAFVGILSSQLWVSRFAKAQTTETLAA